MSTRKPIGIYRQTISDHLEDPDAFARERTEALQALFGKYGIEDGDWRELAGTLAFKHEPTCKIINPSGPKPKYEAVEMFQMVLDYAHKHDVSQTKAAEEVFGYGTNAHRQFEKFRDEANPKLWDNMNGGMFHFQGEKSPKRRPHKGKNTS
jgi:hypothetical protein